MLYIIAGILLGILFGALPGIGAVLGMAILLPLTIYIDGSDALILLASIYSGGMYGGSISAILFNVPGTPAAAATTFDGYEMSKQGMSITALATSAAASAIGGLITVFIIILLTPILIDIVLLFGSVEFFLLALFGIALITVVVEGSVLKGLVAGAAGLAITTIGIAPTTARLRYTFDYIGLYDGLSFVAVMIGLFAISEMIKLSPSGGAIAESGVELTGSKLEGIKNVISHPVLLLKSSLIGLIVGSIPGSGAEVSNFVSYGEAVRSSEDPESFGTGDPRGVIAAEASNNSTVAGALIPTISFGIPGGAAAAVLLGGLIMHGLRPGSDMFEQFLPTTYALYFALVIGNILILFIGLYLVTRFSYLTKINTHYIIPVIVVLSIVGGFALRSNWWDILTIVAVGFYGYYMKKHNYSVIAFVLGAVLGSIAESNFYRSLQISDGSYLIFVSRPISAILVVLIFGIIFTPLLKPYVETIVRTVRS